MATERRMQFVHWQLVWMLGSILVLVVFDALSLESVFICSLIGLLIITELTAPFAVEPSWRKRLPWLVIAGLVGFAVVIGRWLLALLPPEMVGL
ncbi:hypothetical protein [Natronolimnobius baerhuensis]|uniref:Uncharacterized protein n=1 Tax=Natronolimnobius baerhuensis TaxID=253108 RepID=A0A202EAB4_9EURY|nr:hypothetical protein [Natronolimnobius baerhuensis]OVE85164.1 hypothetical protein B2G88_12570 [Natronolimnobius baerhuensis]